MALKKLRGCHIAVKLGCAVQISCRIHRFDQNGMGSGPVEQRSLPVAALEPHHAEEVGAVPSQLKNSLAGISDAQSRELGFERAGAEGLGQFDREKAAA